MKKPFVKENKSILKEIFRQRWKIHGNFIRKQGNPVLVHSTYNPNTFEKILIEEEIKIPKYHDSPKLSPYMEKLLGTDNTIYYSLGFIYQVGYNWKYAFIFDLKYLKELTYYENALGYMSYRILIDIWHDYDKEYFDKVANTNKLTRKVFDRYLNEIQEGKRTKKFEFWKIEKIVFDAFMNYSGKKKILRIIRREIQKLIKKYPYSVRLAKKDWKTKKVPEIIGRKNNSLLKNKNFLGFYLKGKISRKIQNLLLDKYSNKILFDGRKVNIVSDILK